LTAKIDAPIVDRARMLEHDLRVLAEPPPLRLVPGGLVGAEPVPLRMAVDDRSAPYVVEQLSALGRDGTTPIGDDITECSRLTP